MVDIPVRRGCPTPAATPWRTRPVRDAIDRVPADPTTQRGELVQRLREELKSIDDAVLGAFEKVPRHLFLPDVPPGEAYRNEAIVTKRNGDGRPVSSSSQPAIMALMLGQLDLAPGQRVLEIGAAPVTTRH